MSAAITVLHLRQGAGLYGADRAVLALAQATGAPFSAVVGSVQRPGGADALSEEAARRGLRARRFDSAARFDLRCARAVARAAKEEGAQLLHAHDFKTLFIALLAGLLARVPVVATYHGDTGSTLAVRVYEVVGRLLGNLTRGVAAVSRVLEQKLRRWVPAAPVVFVPNGLPLPLPVSREERLAARAALRVPEAAYCVAVVGRLSPEKGHAHLFEALRVLPGEVVLLVAGDGPLRAALETAARGLDARFLGYLADARAVFAAADVIALPSLTEGLPLVALESLALGRTLVASAVGELPELLAGGAGALVPAGDAQALAAALLEVRPEAVRLGMVKRAQERARTYDAQAMASSYASLYGRALSLSPMPSSSK